ncbi:MAG: hypothetical protein ACLRFE_02440, partial [Clostridia bacterium]
SPTYLNPSINLDITLTTKGAKISLDTNPLFNYEIYSKSNNQTRLIGTYNEELYDDKVFCHKAIDYYAVATNKYTNIQYTSDTITIYPESYVIDILNKSFINKNRQTKTKWYI